MASPALSVVLLVVIVSSTTSGQNVMLRASELFDSVLADNDVRLRPFYGTDRPVVVTVNITQFRITRVCDDCEKCWINMALLQSWDDRRLSFRENQLADGRTLVFRDDSLFWTPDVHIAESVEQPKQLSKPFLFIHPNGTVVRTQRLSAVVRCALKLDAYPHDRQSVLLSFVSESTDNSLLQLRWPFDSSLSYSDQRLHPLDSHTSILDDYDEQTLDRSINRTGLEPDTTPLPPPIDYERAAGQTFFIERVDAQVARVERRLDRFSGNQYSVLRLRLRMRRQTFAFVWSLYLPTLALCLVAWLPLLLFAGRRDVLSAGVRLVIPSVTLHLSGLLLATGGAVGPGRRTSYLRAIDLWLGFVCLFQLLTLVLTAVHLSRRSTTLGATATAAEAESLVSPAAPNNNNVDTSAEEAHARAPQERKAAQCDSKGERCCALVLFILLGAFTFGYAIVFC